MIPVLNNIIFDTDMYMDCDDVGALAVLHHLSSRGKVNILAAVCDSVCDYGAPCIECINRYYRHTMPIGTVKVNGFSTDSRYSQQRLRASRFNSRISYNENIIRGTPFENKMAADYPDAVEVYRKVLSQQPDNSVTICVVGFLTAVEQLLKSGPDVYSDLDGPALLRQKAQVLVCMSIVSPYTGTPAGGFNWEGDLTAARYVVAHSPVNIAISSYGEDITTGELLRYKLPEDHPVRRAYEVYLNPAHLFRPVTNRPSWDQVAVLYASHTAPWLFHEKKPGMVAYSDSGNRFLWTGTTGERQDLYIEPAVKVKKLEKIIEAMMSGMEEETE